MNAHYSDTIFALSTPAGRGGVAVVRVSGAAAFESLQCLTGQPLPTPRMASLRVIKDSQSYLIDHALVLRFVAPHSFTGENIVEYHLHGGRAVVEGMLHALSEQPNHRLAEPGEFTRRAFENGKLDLTEAEAIGDLIHAETLMQRRQAVAQMGGQLAQIYAGWADHLSRALAWLEADLDFPDEDLPDGVADHVRPVILKIEHEIEAHLNDNRRGERLRDGLQLAIMGAPNAGKSSLINVLTQRDVAIVSSIAGTTRDIVDVTLDIGGYPFIIADTAGLRQNIGQTDQDSIEAEGIKRARSRAMQADLCLCVFDATLWPDLDTETYALSQRAGNIMVFNKVDQVDRVILDQISQSYPDAIMISVHSQQGMMGLLDLLLNRAKDMMGNAETPSLTRQRHRHHVQDCLESLKRSHLAPLPEMMAEDIRLALRMIGRITGRVDIEDLLDIIFKDFCIGK
jgi:tRNA modification GTPase